MFYVYQLVDPRTDAPFYVGKGRGDRVNDHEREARRGRISRKCERIREIWSLGMCVKHEIIQTFRREVDALAHERGLISRIGLDNLTNIYRGSSRGRGYKRFWRSEHLVKLGRSLARALVKLRKYGSLWSCGEDVTWHVKWVLGELVRDLGARTVEAELRKYADIRIYVRN